MDVSGKANAKEWREEVLLPLSVVAERLGACLEGMPVVKS